METEPLQSELHEVVGYYLFQPLGEFLPFGEVVAQLESTVRAENE